MKRVGYITEDLRGSKLKRLQMKVSIQAMVWHRAGGPPLSPTDFCFNLNKEEEFEKLIEAIDKLIEWHNGRSTLMGDY
ncbi:MAG: hypothetical protein KAS32_19985 [Candidatus Peribacteraceae bacterium]|nr:hypothetical protein [Candidatus Peribacteraceae bacterium]